MKIVVVGSGKLASAILNADSILTSYDITPWEQYDGKESDRKTILIHAGSGRQLEEAINFCSRTKSIFIELSTGLKTETMTPDFPLVICPNTSILLLKTLKLLSLSGKYFAHEKIRIIESHQASKTSAPGTAYKIAEAFNIASNEVESIRNPDVQLKQIVIPEEFLEKHAYHKVIIGEANEQISIETKILGHDSYVSGVNRILKAVVSNPLSQKRYSVLDLIDENLL